LTITILFRIITPTLQSSGEEVMMTTYQRAKQKTTVRPWLAAIVICLLVGSAWQLDSPSDIEVMQMVAVDKLAAESGK
jgi:hypothetical protein